MLGWRSIVATATVGLAIAACGGNVEGDGSGSGSGAGSGSGSATTPTNTTNDGFPVVSVRCDGVGSVEANTCVAPSLPEFVPPPWVPPAPPRSACNDDQLTAFETACLTSSPTSASCIAFMQEPSTAACGACILTPDTAPAYGPVIWHASMGEYEINDGGCLALTLNDTSAGGCGAKLQALIECTTAACTNCNVTTCNDGTCGELPQCLCTTAAEGGACKRYVEDAACTAPLLSDGNPLYIGCAAFWEPSPYDYFSVARTVCE